MKRRRHLLGGLLLVTVAVVLASAEWTVLDARVIWPIAAVVGVSGLANVAAGLGYPAAVRDRTNAVETVTFLAFSLLGLAIVIENGLAPDGFGSYFHAAIWGSAAVVFGWLGVRRLRSWRSVD